jgi:hypothetical protein
METLSMAGHFYYIKPGGTSFNHIV